MDDKVIESNWIANWTTILGFELEELHIFGWFYFRERIIE
jgi:hypothetical protein